MTMIRTAPDDVYGVHLCIGDSTGIYRDVIARATVVEGSLGAQATAIAEAVLISFVDLAAMDELEARIVDGLTADEAQCTVLGLLPSLRMLVGVPARISWAGGRPVLTIDRRSPMPWRQDAAGNAYVDWERIERMTRAYVVDPDQMPVPVPTMEPTPAVPEDPADELQDASTPPPPADSAPSAPSTETKAAGKEAPEPRNTEKKSAEKMETVAPVGGLPPVRSVVIPEGTPWTEVMEDVPLSGSDLNEWNNMSHIIRQYQMLAGKVPLLGGPAMEMDGDDPAITAALRERFPWMEKVLEAVTQACHEQLAAGHAWFTMRPTILVGPAGCGKSSFARALAKTAGLGWNMLDCAATHDAVTIAGTPRGYSTATPNFAAVVMERSSSANPVIHLDEIDKATRSHQGYVPDSILGMTEPSTATAYYDQCLHRRMNLTHCTWIATANDVSMLSGPMRGRFNVIEVPPARGEHVDSVIREIASEVAEEWSLRISDLAEIPEESRDLLADQLDRGSLRQVARSLRMLWSRDLIDNGRSSLN